MRAGARRSGWVWALPMAVWFAVPGSDAQSPVDGAIAGQVVSAQGEAIAGAVIALAGEQGLQRSATSDRRGEFLMIRLPPGEYLLKAHADGYRGAVQLQTTVELGRTTEVQLGHAVVAAPKARRRSDPGAGRIRLVDLSGKEMTVSTVQPAGAATATVVGLTELEGLPVAGRDWTALGLESAGAQVDPEADGASLITVRGMAPTENSMQVDGVSHDQSFGGVPVGTGGTLGLEAEDDDAGGAVSLPGGASGGGIGQGSGGRHAGAAYTFSQSAVREFRLNENSYSALYGKGAGGVTTAVSKSGGNRLHGSGFWTVRDAGWGAANPYSVATTYADGLVTSGVVKPQDLRQQFGGTVGGPLWRDRVFYFGAYDQQLRNFPAVSSPVNALFYSLTATQTALLGTRGVKQAQVNAALNYLSSLTGMVPRRHDQTVMFGKMDWKVGAKSTLSGQYNRVRWDSPAGASTAAVVARGAASLGNNQGQVDEAAGRWTMFLGARVSNDVRVLYGHDFQYETAQQPLPQEPAISVGGYAPEVSIGPEGILFGTPAALGRKAYPDERRLELADTFAWMKGRHLLRAGGSISRVNDYLDALNNQEGTFHYDSGVTGGKAGGLVDWITDYTFNVHAYPNGGCPSINAKVHDFCFRSYSQSFGQQTTTFDSAEWTGFAQDDWRVRPGLTLTLGARYEYSLLPFPQTPNQALDAIFGKTGATSVFPEDRNNFGPRAGVLWQSRWMHGGVIRMGYGAFYGRLPGTTIRTALVDTALPTSATHVRIVPGTETLCPQVTGVNQGFGYPCAYVAMPPAAVATTTSAIVFDRRYRLPMVQQGSFSVEHGMASGILASATVVVNEDRQLPGSVDLNIAPSAMYETFQIKGGAGAKGVVDGEQFVLPLYTSRVSTSYGPVTDIVSHGNGTYEGLVLEARRRGHGGRRLNGLDLRVNWTWSKAIDYGQTGGGVPRTNTQLDPFTLGYDKGLSNLNYPHRITASAVWAPVVASESRWVRRALNGWEAAPIFVESSGRGYSYQIFGGTRLKGGHESINGSGGATYLPTVGRNTLRLPEQMQTNLRVSRAVGLGERVRVRGVAEIFNVANHVNVSGVETRAFLVGVKAGGITPLIFQDSATVASEGLNTRSFGQYTAAGTSQARERQIQLGIKVEF